MWAKARSAFRPRSVRTWGARVSAAWAGWEKPRAQLVVGEQFRRTRQQGSRGGDSKGPLRVRKNQRVWRVGEKKGRGRGAAGRLLVSERKRENCRDTATRAKTKFYSYSRTRTTRMTIFIPLGGPRSEHNIDRWRNLHRSILHCQLNRLQSKSGTKLLSCLL